MNIFIIIHFFMQILTCFKKFTKTILKERRIYDKLFV